MPQALAVISTLLLALPALAHDGHGLEGSHPHSSDVWGFVALAMVIAVAFWKGKK